MAPQIIRTDTGRIIAVANYPAIGNSSESAIDPITGKVFLAGSVSSLRITVPAILTIGIKWTNNAKGTRFRLTNYSPEDKALGYYLSNSFVWCPWSWNVLNGYYVGGSVCVLLNKEPTYVGNEMVTNYDYLFQDYINPPNMYNDKEVADLSRGDYWEFDLADGEYIKLIVQDTPHNDNRGGVTFDLIAI